MITIRYGLQRYFLRQCGVDIINNENFKPANDVFAAMLVKLKAEGKGATLHKEPIAKEDMIKIMSSSALDCSTPRGLQNKVFVDIMIYLCNSGLENLRNMTKSHFIVQTDSTDLKFVSFCQDMQTKNHRGGIDDGEISQGGRMYETAGNSLCPVRSFELYVQKLNPNCESFWQRPKASVKFPDDNIWYDNMQVGKNSLAEKMKKISTEANCSRVYTNHCLRATTVTTLDSEGFEARHIMGVSGHKSENSIRSYSRVDEQTKREMSRALSGNIQGNSTKADERTPGEIVHAQPGPTSPLSPARERSNLSELTNSPVLPVNIVTQQEVSSSKKTINYHFHGCVVNIHNN